MSNLIQSFGQDLIYAVTCSQHTPPKHVLLPYAVKTLTGNTEIIRILTKYGHGMSYTPLEENDTALCLQKLASGLDKKVSLPASIKPHVFTNLAWDNIDRIEETLTGKGTSHCVNGIVVQPRVFGPNPPHKDVPSIDKKKQRTLSTKPGHEIAPNTVANATKITALATKIQKLVATRTLQVLSILP